MNDQAPDPNESARAETARRNAFKLVVVLSAVTMATILLIGPFASPEEGTRPLWTILVPLVEVIALAGAMVWLTIQLRR